MTQRRETRTGPRLVLPVCPDCGSDGRQCFTRAKKARTEWHPSRRRVWENAVENSGKVLTITVADGQTTIVVEGGQL